MQKVIVRIDWYTKTILTVIAALLFGILAKSLIMPEKAVAEQEPSLLGDYLGLRGAAKFEGSAERAEGDVEEMYMFIQQGRSSVVKTDLIESEYYQEHPEGRRYLEYLIEKTQTTERARLFIRPASSVIKKIGDRYFVYNLK